MISASSVALQVGQIPWVAELILKPGWRLYLPVLSLTSQHQAHCRNSGIDDVVAPHGLVFRIPADHVVD